MLQINPAKHFLHAVPGGDLEGGIGKGDPEIRIGDEKDLGRGIDGGDQAPDVGLETETAAGVLKHHERVGVSARGMISRSTGPRFGSGRSTVTEWSISGVDLEPEAPMSSAIHDQ